MAIRADVQNFPHYASVAFLVLLALTMRCSGSSNNNRPERSVDGIGDGFIKQSDKSEGREKRRLDRIGSGFIKREDPVERSLPKLEYLLAQTLVNKLRTSADSEPLNSFHDGAMQKRYIDRIGNGFIKRNLDRIGVGFIKRENSGSMEVLPPSKRRLDRIGSGFIKRRHMGYPSDQNLLNDKRYVDRLGSGFIKRMSNGQSIEPEIEYNKRYLDRIGSGFVR